MPVSKILSLSPALYHSEYSHPLLFAGVKFQNRPRKEKILEIFMGPPQKRCSIFNIFLYNNIFVHILMFLMLIFPLFIYPQIMNMKNEKPFNSTLFRLSECHFATGSHSLVGAFLLW